MEKIFEQQREFQNLINNPTHFITPYDKIKACNIQVRRAIDELNEALREMPFDLSGYGKSKKIYSISNIKILDEIVDAQLFIINTLNILNINSNLFETQCQIKQQKNIERFKTKKRYVEKNDNFLIVIEGPDGIGKSTICNLLSKKIGYPVLRMPDTSNDIEEYSQFYRQTISKINQVFILDRFYPSSIVYGQFFNRNVLLNDLKDIINNRNIFTFIIDNEIPYRNDLLINEEQWPKIRQIYLQQAKINKWKIIPNNTTLMNCVHLILEELQF